MRTLRFLACALPLLFLGTAAHAEDPAPKTTTEATTPKTASPVVDLVKQALTLEAEGRRKASRDVYRKILTVEPDHRLARTALGFVRIDGTWKSKRAARKTVETQVRAARAAKQAVAPAKPASPEAIAQERRRKLAVETAARRLVYAEPATRIRAAETLGKLGGEVAAAHLIRRLELTSGNAPKAYISTIAQQSYIQDFDVEVASTSFIADPIVGVIQSGAVLGVNVHATRSVITTPERVAVKSALEELSGKRLGTKARAWWRWHRKTFARKKAAK